MLSANWLKGLSMNYLKYAVCTLVRREHIQGRKFRMKVSDKAHEYFRACTYCGHVSSAPKPVPRKKKGIENES